MSKRDPDRRTDVDLPTLIEAGYQDLVAELDREGEVEAEDEPDRHGAKTVMIDAQSAAIDYAVASSLCHAVRPTPKKTPSNVRVILGRFHTPPPMNRTEEELPYEIVVGTPSR